MAAMVAAMAAGSAAEKQKSKRDRDTKQAERANKEGTIE